MSYVIGVDLGTQSLKGLLVDPEGKIVAEATCAHDPIYPNPGWAEQPVEDYLHSFTTVIKQLVADSGIGPCRDRNDRHGCYKRTPSLATDENGNALMNCIIWLDRRAEAETAEIAKTVDPARVFEVSGLNLDSTHTAAKMLWIKKTDPTSLKRQNIF